MSDEPKKKLGSAFFVERLVYEAQLARTTEMVSPIRSDVHETARNTGRHACMQAGRQAGRQADASCWMPHHTLTTRGPSRRSWSSRARVADWGPGFGIATNQTARAPIITGAIVNRTKYCQ